MGYDFAKTIALLEELLEKERKALLEGNLASIGHMLDKKTQLIEEINDSQSPDVQALSRLGAKIERNQTLLQSAMDGIKTVSDRLEAMRHVRSSIETYDAWGKKNQINMPKKGEVEKHA